MKTQIPTLDQFEYKSLDSAVLGHHSGAEASFSVEVVPARITQRVVVGFLDKTTNKGISVAFFPATGEVCDLSSDGGVIGYLSETPLIPGDPVACELKINRFGVNFVCSARINGELFLYPAFSVPADASSTLTAFVGQENDGSHAMVGWSGAQVKVSAMPEPVAA